MNCVSFLIDAGIAYRNIAHNIEELFGRIATVMERFQIYRAHEDIMHPAMIRVANRLLMAVVSICGLCIKVLRKNPILKLLNVAAFSSDGGIKSQFDVLAALEAEELQMKGTLTLVATETSKRDIAAGFEQVKATGTEIWNSVSQLSASATEQAVLADLKEKLDVDDSASKAEYRAYQNKLVSGICSWIKDDSQYQSWSDVSQSEKTLLVLKGDEGCGKSYALTAIIRDLMNKYPQGQNNSSRTSIGYYYLTKAGRREGVNSKGGASVSKSSPSIRDALRTWAWQAINNDLFYRKDVAAMFKKSSDLGDVEDVWQMLFLNHLEKGANFLLLLDGVHELEEEELSHLTNLLNFTTASNKKGVGRVKLMIASRIPFVLKLSTKIGADFAISDLRDKSRLDMQGFIREKADALDIFQKDTPQILQLKERVCSGLLDGVKGSFLLADVKLREIASKYDPEEVMQVVEKTMKGSNLNDSMLEDIRECNRTLNAREIQNLNTLLLWTIHGEGVFLIYELEALLYIQHGRTSLQPLSGDIRDKYSAFFKIDGHDDDPYAGVVLRYDSIADYFRNASRDEHSPDTAGNQSLSKGEIQMVQHFIEKLCEQEIYTKLGLQAFFDQKLSQSDLSVSVDCENAHATIALTCLRVLTGEFPEEAEGMRWYSGFYLTEHLKNIDLDNIDPRLKAELGPRLVGLFTDPVIIKKSNEQGARSWSYNDDGSSDVVRLLRSSAVMKKITGVDQEKKRWVDAVMTDARPEIALLLDAAKVNAEVWLSAENAQVALASFEWLYGYLNKTEKEAHPDVERLEEAPPRAAIEATAIEEVLQMVTGLQTVDTSQSTVLRNLAVTYRECEHIPQAIEYFQRALAADPDYLNAHAGLALAYAAESEKGPEPDWDKALHHLDIVIDRANLGEVGSSDLTPEAELSLYLDWKASWLRKTLRYDEACAIYNDILQKNPTDDEARLELIYTLCETQAYSSVVEMLQELQNEVDQETQRTNLSRFFRTHGNDHVCHHTIVRAFKRTDSITEIKSHYRQVVEEFQVEKTKKDRNSTQIHCSLMYHFAAILYAQAANGAEKEEAIDLWERIIVKANTGSSIIEPVVLSARRLAKSYIAKAVEAGRDSAVADEMLRKVKAFSPPPDGETTTDDERSLGLSRADVRALMGRYYSAVQDFEKAKEELRPAVGVGIGLLSDDDPENDYQGYRKLGDAFMDFGDDANAVAAWCMIQPTDGLPTEQTVSEAASPPDPEFASTSEMLVENGTANEARSRSSGNEAQRNSADEGDLNQRPTLQRANTSHIARSLEGPLSYSCDGQCGKYWTYADDFYVCRECIDVQFDGVCLAKLRKGEIARDICDPNHRFMHVPPWSLESLKRAQEGKVLVGDRVLEVGAWLEDIKQEWNDVKS